MEIATRYIPQAEEPAEHRRIGAFRKRWPLAAIKWGNKAEHHVNVSTEYYFVKVLAKVKQLYATQREYVFERDYRHDNTESAFSMHSFICNSFYMRLDCDFLYNYNVEYDFDNCPFEQQIKHLFQTMGFVLDRARQQPQQTDVATFFKGVIAYQHPKHFKTLTEQD
jgi:hypothetical protein